MNPIGLRVSCEFISIENFWLVKKVKLSNELVKRAD